ncbi:PqiC family protein [uncultured Desulfuromusa sp.]|uniref:PqiC family protein n=1 Tax=uncultured Desulfuromusa sp. TaxID=219183 RepID=UPI002AA7FCDE|nr:PqiC family protein [uncultured Desulfuromusa sp.]
MRYLIFVLLFLCSSCIQIGGTPQPMNYYLLKKTNKIPEIHPNFHEDIHLELINFPEYLDQPQIVTNNDDNGILFYDTERWAEPLRENLARVIRENLAMMAPNSSISVGPWESATANAIKVELLFNQFSGKLGEYTRTDIRWRISQGTGQTSQGHFTDQQTIEDNFQDFVIGLNTGINNFSTKLGLILLKP